MVLPLLLLAPTIAPVLVPSVQAKELAALDVKANAGLVALQILVVKGLFVITGFGLTVTVMVEAVPTQPPVVDVGVTIYFTEPAVALLGLVNT